MAVEIKRKNNESIESLLRRFQDKVKRSRVLILAKKNRYHEKEENKSKKRVEAKRRQFNRAKRKYLIKVGKLQETTGRSNGKNFAGKGKNKTTH